MEFLGAGGGGCRGEKIHDAFLDVHKLQLSKMNFQRDKNVFFLRDYQLRRSKKLPEKRSKGEDARPVLLSEILLVELK